MCPHPVFETFYEDTGEPVPTSRDTDAPGA